MQTDKAVSGPHKGSVGERGGTDDFFRCHYILAWMSALGFGRDCEVGHLG